MTIWREYQAAAQSRRAAYDEAMGEFNERWDKREMAYNFFAHNDIMTNEERWMLGRMTSQDYFNEVAMRDLNSSDKYKKMRDDLSVLTK